MRRCSNTLTARLILCECRDPEVYKMNGIMAMYYSATYLLNAERGEFEFSSAILFGWFIPAIQEHDYGEGR